MKIFSLYFTEKILGKIRKILRKQFLISFNMIYDDNKDHGLYSKGFHNLIPDRPIDFNIGKSKPIYGKTLIQTNPLNITILSKYLSEKLMFNIKKSFFEELTHSLVSQLNLISEKTRNGKRFKSSEKLKIPKRSMSSVENIYCIKADEMNKPVFFSKENNKELNYCNNKPISNEMLTNEASLDESSIMFPNLVINENMSDHLGKNAQIESYFEEYENKKIHYEQLFHNIKNELILVKPLIIKNKSLREAVFDKLSKGNLEKNKILLSVYESILSDSSAPQKIIRKSESFNETILNFNDSKPKIIEHSSSKTKLPFFNLAESSSQFSAIFTPDNKSKKFTFFNSFSSYSYTNLYKNPVIKEDLLGKDRSRNKGVNKECIQLRNIKSVNKN